MNIPQTKLYAIDSDKRGIFDIDRVVSAVDDDDFLKIELMFCRTRLYFITKRSLRLIHIKRGKNMNVKLAETGAYMPTLGLGTWQAPPDIIEKTVQTALELGYRHFDTAFNYNNEEAIGAALEKWLNFTGTREELFITTKLPHIGNRASDVKKFVDEQLKRLQLTYIDLYLIHVPFGFKANPETLSPIVKPNGEYELDMETDHVSTWEEMEMCMNKGLIRNIGLSNFNQQQIQKILDQSTIKPQVLQVELHAYHQQPKLRQFCKDNNIAVMAYAPLGSPGAKDHFVNKYKYNPEVFPDLLGHPVVNEIAMNHRRTPAQILLNYLVQDKVVVIPKSTNLARLKENMDIFDFELTAGQKENLKQLDKGEQGRIFNFLFWKGVENHPEYPFKLSEKDGIAI